MQKTHRLRFCFPMNIAQDLPKTSCFHDYASGWACSSGHKWVSESAEGGGGWKPQLLWSRIRAGDGELRSKVTNTPGRYLGLSPELRNPRSFFFSRCSSCVLSPPGSRRREGWEARRVKVQEEGEKLGGEKENGRCKKGMSKGEGGRKNRVNGSKNHDR